MEKITLGWLIERKACQASIEIFEQRFGKETDIKEAVDCLRKLNKPIWEGWLLAQDLSLAKELLASGINIHAGNNFALWQAVYDNNLEMVKFLLDNGIDINENALYSAAENDRLEIFEYFAVKGVNIRANDATICICCAQNNGHTEMANFLRKITKKAFI